MSGICSRHRHHQPDCELCAVAWKALLKEAFQAGGEMGRLAREDWYFEQWYQGQMQEKQEAAGQTEQE